MTLRPVRRGVAAAAALVAVPTGLLAGCAPAGDADDRLTVLAAASLTDAFEELATDFEEDHPGVDVRLSFGSSTTLAEQAAQGAPGDVLATADEEAMAVAEEGGALEGAPVAFATNALVLAVPAGNPAGVDGPGDLTGATWVRCADEVPCGRATTELLADTAPGAEAASLEVDVRAVLAKVAAGEADAGFVYATDAAAAGDDVEVVGPPDAGGPRVTAYAAVLDRVTSPGLARDWLALLTSDGGRAVLRGLGFGAP